MKPGAPSLQSTLLLDKVRERVGISTIASKYKIITSIRFVFHPLQRPQSNGMPHPLEMGMAGGTASPLDTVLKP
jgi:hypothetical protein